MQHYGIPTRLLDFTYSPFVALYFAIREQCNDKERSHVRLWAIDETAVNARFKGVVHQAETEARKRAGEVESRLRIPSMHPYDFATDGDIVISEIQELPPLIAKALRATGTLRGELERQGSVAVASPPAFNPRLASQQGVFLVNCAESLSFGESLKRMMASHRAVWCKRFDISTDAIPHIEQKLFQMNIHEQSLFPDMEGLAGFIRQRARLHWK
jgi:FRG domain-containing protein